MKNYIQQGEIMPFTAEAAVSSGDLVKVSSVVGVAVASVAEGDTGSMQIVGVFEVPKETGAIDQGEALYYKASTGKVTTTATGNTFAGYAFSSAISADSTVQIKINF